MIHKDILTSFLPCPHLTRLFRLSLVLYIWDSKCLGKHMPYGPWVKEDVLFVLVWHGRILRHRVMKHSKTCWVRAVFGNSTSLSKLLEFPEKSLLLCVKGLKYLFLSFFSKFRNTVTGRWPMVLSTHLNSTEILGISVHVYRHTQIHMHTRKQF